MKALFLSACIMCFTSLANAQYASVKDIGRMLTSLESFEQNLGKAYLMGVFDAGQNILFCTPATPPVEKLVELYISGMVAEPESFNQPGDYFIVMPLQTMYPCKLNAKPTI